MNRILWKYKIIKIKKGSMMVEAAIFLPLFIIAVVTICCLIKAIWIQMFIFNTFTDQVKQLLVIDSINLENEIDSVLESEGLEKGHININGAGSIISIAGLNDVGKIKMDYNMDINFPISFVDEATLKNELTFRKWKGLNIKGNALSFDRMEEYEDGTKVYVFPRAGNKYHKENCRYVNSYKITQTLNASIRKDYGACPLCTEGDEYNGQTVYVFKYGCSYHEDGCPAVDKNTVCMDKRDAELKSYSRCSVCGG